MSNEPKHVSNQILGMLKAGITEEDARIKIESSGGKLAKISSNGRLTALLIEAPDVEKTMATLQQSDYFDTLQLNYLGKKC